MIELLGFLSDEKIKMCAGTVGNSIKSFSKKSMSIRKSLKNQILKEPVINEDETPISVNGKIMSTIGIFTKAISFLDAFANRKLESFEEMGILNKYIEKANCKKITPHGFRHSHVSLLINLGCDSRDVAERIGDTIEVVEKTYYHMFPEKKKIPTNKLNELKLRGKNEVKHI